MFSRWTRKTVTVTALETVFDGNIQINKHFCLLIIHFSRTYEMTKERLKTTFNFIIPRDATRLKRGTQQVILNLASLFYILVIH